MALRRRMLLLGSTGVLTMLAGCSGVSSVLDSTGESPPHWVTVYLGDREETHDVTVTVRDSDDETLFEQSYQLSDGNEADEDATFPASTDPETVVVTVDGTRFERDWPGFETEQLPCDGPNTSGIEVYIENTDGRPGIRIEPDCQSVGESR
ncbi:hypothetical protein [Halosegnis longus]|uniref:hypothetical protein n=1 Tax=Halosegnis longus TaxID=2216012 RepID=UPI0018F43812